MPVCANCGEENADVAGFCLARGTALTVMALAFYRSVDAKASLRDAEIILAQTA